MGNTFIILNKVDTILEAAIKGPSSPVKRVINKAVSQQAKERRLNPKPVPKPDSAQAHKLFNDGKLESVPGVGNVTVKDALQRMHQANNQPTSGELKAREQDRLYQNKLAYQKAKIEDSRAGTYRDPNRPVSVPQPQATPNPQPSYGSMPSSMLDKLNNLNHQNAKRMGFSTHTL